MKNHIFLVGLVVLATFLQNPSTVIALDGLDQKTDVKIESVKVGKLTNEQIVESLVDKYSAEYGVSKTDMMRTLRNENDTFQFDRQSEIRYKEGNRWKLPAGTRERSFGVAQIHLPDNPHVTEAQAKDPDFSIEFMAQKFSEGKARMWMGYRKN